jgi:hypothetical protein
MHVIQNLYYSVTTGVGFGKEFLIGEGEAGNLVGRLALRETVLAFPVVLDVPAGALNEIPGQGDALRLREGSGVPGIEFRP